MKRRTLLTGLGVGLAGLLIGTVPTATDGARLDADIAVVDWTVNEPFVPSVTFRLKNQAGDPITPVVMPWGKGATSQQAWPIVRGPDRLAPGEQAIYRIKTDYTRLLVGKPALLVVYDKGTQQRAWEQFTPTKHP